MTSKRNDSFFKKSTAAPLSDSKSADFFVKSSSSSDGGEKVQKKVFNKAKWRSQKYSLKTKLESWSNKRAEYFRHEYKKEQNRHKAADFDVNKIYEEEERRAKEDPQALGSEDEEEGTQVSSRKKRKKIDKAEMISLKRKEKEEREAEFLRRKAEKEEAIARYRRNKIEKHRKLSKKTKKGQPLMKGRMELLLERIQRNASE